MKIIILSAGKVELGGLHMKAQQVVLPKKNQKN